MVTAVRKANSAALREFEHRSAEPSVHRLVAAMLRVAVMVRLDEIQVLVLDCQASGATPAYGDLIELGWTSCTGAKAVDPVRSHWIVPRTDRPIRPPIRELTGWTEACISEAIEDTVAWAELRKDALRIMRESARPSAPTVIHFARFELGFLRELHQRLG